MLKKILVAVDGSEASLRATRFAARLARSAGAHLTLTFVYDTGVVSLLGMVALTGKELDDAVQRVAHRHFLDAEAAIGGDVPTERKLLMGKPSSELMRYAKEAGMDVIVMGSRGMSATKEILVGSVSSQVVHHSAVPVTVVH